MLHHSTSRRCAARRTTAQHSTTHNATTWAQALRSSSYKFERFSDSLPSVPSDSMASSTSARKDALRAGRAGAVRSFNDLAAELGVDGLPCRPLAAAMTKFWTAVCEAASPQHVELLTEARSSWLDSNGGGSLPERLLPSDGGAVAQQGASELVESHRMLGGTGAAGQVKKPFRLRSKAFLLTFNSTRFSGTEELWNSFLVWIGEQVQRTRATQWSAAMERSLHSRAPMLSTCTRTSAGLRKVQEA